MMPNREGLFHAYPVAIGLGETRENKLLQVVIQYRLFEELLDGQWADCSGERLEITGYHILEKRDHSLNDSTIEALKAALGWDGRDPFDLQDNAAALAQQPVQVKLGYEEYNGQQSLKVQFLNPYGAKAGGVPRADDDLRRSVTNRLGAKFRAYAGGTPVNPPRPAGRPAVASAKADKPAVPPAHAQSPIPECSMEEAWAAFCQAYEDVGTGGRDEDREQQWFSAIAQVVPGRQVDAITRAEWANVKASAPSMIVRF